MNPKQKAKELVESFENASSNKISDYSIIYTPTAKVCALMCVDQMRIASKRITEHLPPDWIGKEQEYYNEIEKEISKL